MRARPPRPNPKTKPNPSTNPYPHPHPDPNPNPNPNPTPTPNPSPNPNLNPKGTEYFDVGIVSCRACPETALSVLAFMAYVALGVSAIVVLRYVYTRPPSGFATCALGEQRGTRTIVGRFSHSREVQL